MISLLVHFAVLRNWFAQKNWDDTIYIYGYIYALCSHMQDLDKSCKKGAYLNILDMMKSLGKRWLILPPANLSYA